MNDKIQSVPEAFIQQYMEAIKKKDNPWQHNPESPMSNIEIQLENWKHNPDTPTPHIETKTIMYPSDEREKNWRVSESVNEKQVGGTHYKTTIQPWDFIHKNGIGFLAGNVIKYVTRYRQKDGLKDLQKAMHYLEKLIEEESHEPRR